MNFKYKPDETVVGSSFAIVLSGSVWSVYDQVTNVGGLTVEKVVGILGVVGDDGWVTVVGLVLGVLGINVEEVIKVGFWAILV